MKIHKTQPQVKTNHENPKTIKLSTEKTNNFSYQKSNNKMGFLEQLE
jgi:hypothetical protein